MQAPNSWTLTPLLLLQCAVHTLAQGDVFSNLVNGFNWQQLVGGLTFLGGPQGQGIPGVTSLLSDKKIASTNQGGCLTSLANGDVIGLIITGIIESALNAELQKCQLEVPQQQAQTWFDLIPGLFGNNNNNQGTFNIASIFGAVGQTCQLTAKQEFCRLLQNEVRNPRCNLCNVIAMSLQPEQIKQCACNTVVGGIQGNVQTSVQQCIGSVALGSIFSNQLGGLLTLPGC